MKPSEALKQYFGYDSFHPGQEEIIEAILSRRDALAVMPTGAGKSICYQVPALLFHGITLVISPLISLMQDQVKALNAAGIYAAYVNSSLTETQIAKVLRYAREGKYKIIYIAPERLLNQDFLDFAMRTEISMVTVDEAHCISRWGQDFRPSYMKIVDFIRQLPYRPVISAFTATATEEVQKDIQFILGLENAKVLVTGFDRPNLYFDVEHIAKKDNYVLKYLRNHPDESGIIYCSTRKNVDTLFRLLESSGISAAPYHAGLVSDERKRNQDDFVYDRIRIMVATNAFGMGIDKSNVRFVIHYNMPQSMEDYYQEAGRAGRDGERASCILLFSPQDVIIARYLIENKENSDLTPEDIALVLERDRQRLRLMERYCQTTGCLRNEILRYFGEKTGEDCGNCGNCSRTFREEDMTDAAKWIINCIAEARGRYGVNIITGALVGANRERLREVGATAWKSYGKLENIREIKLKELIPLLERRGYVVRTNDQYSMLRIGPNAMELKDETVRVMIKIREEETGAPGLSTKKEGKTGAKNNSARSSDSLTALGFRLFGELRELRTQIAREQNLPPYIVFADKTLLDMCARLPSDKNEMLDVSGVAKVKYEKYGERFLEAIRTFLEAHPGETISNLRHN